MSKKLLYKYSSSEELFEKLRRDRKRLWAAIQNENETELCDNFFDFCVTAHALRDWVIKENSCVLSENAVHDTCNTYEVLQMCRDIANANKHFGLKADQEKTKKTYSVFVSSSPMIDFYENLSNGSISKVMRDNLDIAIMNEKGIIIGIWEFSEKVEKSWQEVFAKFGIKIS
jgi:hypothetical protein